MCNIYIYIIIRYEIRRAFFLFVHICRSCVFSLYLQCIIFFIDMT